MTFAIAFLCNAIFFAAIAFAALVTTWFRVDFQTFFYTKIIQGSSLSRRDYFHTERLLSQHMAYFRHLSRQEQARFISRVHRFMAGREFEGIRGLQLTPDMPMLISASAVQLTFGLNDFNMQFLKRVRVAPGPVYSRMFKGHMRGAVSPKGVLMLSWPDFLSGYKRDGDNFNLGLHEMAHVLKLDPGQSTTFDLRFGSYIEEWLRIGEGAFKALQKRSPTYLHKYGGTNPHEFFAVCVEHFFETPEQFSEELPDVYNHLCKLLNQNPLNTSGDYKLTAAFKQAVQSEQGRIPLPEKVKKRYGKDGPNRFHFFVVSAFGISLVAGAINANWEVLAWKSMMAVAAGGALLAAVVQLPYIVKHRALGFRWVPFFLLSLLTLTASSYQLLNALIAIEHSTTNHLVHRVEPRGSEQYDLIFKDEATGQEWSNKLNRYVGDPGHLPYTTATRHLRRGCMGFNLLQDVEYQYNVSLTGKSR